MNRNHDMYVNYAHYGGALSISRGGKEGERERERECVGYGRENGGNVLHLIFIHISIINQGYE